MTIWLWWHDADVYDYGCPWSYRNRPTKPEAPPRECTCVDTYVRPLPGRWRQFREVTNEASGATCTARSED